MVLNAICATLCLNKDAPPAVEEGCAPFALEGVMKTNSIIAFLAATTILSRAQTAAVPPPAEGSSRTDVAAITNHSSAQAQPGTVSPARHYLDWDDPKWWESLKTSPQRTISVGGSDYTVQGPLIETWRRPSATAADRPIDRALALPIVSLFVPQRMPTPPPRGTGRYFAWGSRDEPWSNLGDHPIPGPAAWVTVGY